MTWYMNGLNHFMLGMGIAVTDYASTRMAKGKRERMEGFQNTISSIERILDAEEFNVEAMEQGRDVVLDKESAQYAENIAIVKQYLNESGIVRSTRKPTLKKRMQSMLYGQRINNLPEKGKWVLGAGIELGLDVAFYQNNLFLNIFDSAYQAPALVSGLWVGKKAVGAIDWVVKAGDEKRFEEEVKGLLRETPIIDIVLDYKPTEEVETDLADKGVDASTSVLTGVGKGIYNNLSEAWDTAESSLAAVGNFRKNKKAAEQQAADEAKQRYKDLIK